MEWLLVVVVVALLAAGGVFALRRRGSELPEGVLDPSVRANVGRTAHSGDFEGGGWFGKRPW